MRLAFGTFLGMPDPLAFLGDRSFIAPRFASSNVRGHAARLDGRLIGTNFATRWGSFGFFGPLTILPEYWDKGVAQQLLRATEKTFDRWGVRRTALFTFPHSTKHVGLYQKFGYWPTYLTALMARTANGTASTSGMHGPGSEGGEKTCYVKFAAARSGPGAGDRFDRLIEACDAFALSRGATLEGGVNLAREDAFRRLRAHGWQVRAQGVAMLRPHVAGHNRPDAYVIDDWR